MNIELQLIFAIKHRQKIVVKSGGCKRMIEPYLLYQSSTGQKLLHGWQYDGESNTTPPPDWINIRLDSLTELAVTNLHYTEPHQGYNPHSHRFKDVIVFA